MRGSGELDLMTVLAGSRIFGALPKRQLKVISRYSRPATAEAGHVLVTEGQPGAEFCIVVSGACEVTRNGSVTARLGPGDSFGEIAVIDGHPRSATVTAVETTELVVLGQADFEHALKVAPDLSRAIMNQLCAHLRSSDDVGTD